MAVSDEGRRLTEEHRKNQIHLMSRMADVLRELFFSLIDWKHIDSSVPEFVRAAIPEIMKFRHASRILSENYMRDFHDVESPQSPEPEFDPDDFDAVEAAREISSTATGVLKTLAGKGYSPAQAIERAEVSVRTKATKIAADGGRTAVEQWVRSGKGPIGYARVTDGKPCAFCSMLASRGLYLMGKEMPGVGLYRSDAFKESNARFVGDGGFKVHDGCMCNLEPVYADNRGNLKLPGNGDELAKQWASIASGRPEPWLVWQRWIESKTLPMDYEGPYEKQGVKRPDPNPEIRACMEAALTGQNNFEKLRNKGRKTQHKKLLAHKDKQGMLDYADSMRERVDRIEEEIAALKDTGQTDKDVAVRTLVREKNLLLSKISDVVDLAASM